MDLCAQDERKSEQEKEKHKVKLLNIPTNTSAKENQNLFLLKSDSPQVLSSRFPVSKLFIIRESFWWVLLLSLLLVLLIGLTERDVSTININVEGTLVSMLKQKKFLMIVGISLVLITRFAYSALYRARLRFEIIDGRLRITRGIILREQASLPLLPISEIYIKPSWPDLFLGLSNLYLSTPLERMAKFANIRGLRTRDAIALRDLLEAYIARNNNGPAVPPPTNVTQKIPLKTSDADMGEEAA